MKKETGPTQHMNTVRHAHRGEHTDSVVHNRRVSVYIQIRSECRFKPDSYVKNRRYRLLSLCRENAGQRVADRGSEQAIDWPSAVTSASRQWSAGGSDCSSGWSGKPPSFSRQVPGTLPHTMPTSSPSLVPTRTTRANGPATRHRGEAG